MNSVLRRRSCGTLAVWLLSGRIFGGHSARGPPRAERGPPDLLMSASPPGDAGCLCSEKAAVRCFPVAFWFCLGPVMAGCAQNPYVLQGKLETLQQEHTSLSQRYQELQSRMATLDQDNQEQGTLLA